MKRWRQCGGIAIWLVPGQRGRTPVFAPNARSVYSLLVPGPPVQLESAEVQQFLDYVLDHQDESGWLGPEVNTTKPRYLWGRYPFFFGAIQMVEADPSLTDRVVPALHKFVSLANTMLHNGEGLEDWARTRWEDFVMTLQW